MTCVILFLLIIISHQCSGIFNLSEEDHSRMPPLHLRDDYSSCINDHAQYCTVDFFLISNSSSPLYQMILEYSALKPIHYNYTHLQYGICVTQTCKEFLLGKQVDQSDILEACLNKSLYKKYGFGAKVIDYNCNDDLQRNFPLDMWDIVVAVVCIALSMLTVVASLQKVQNDKGDNYLSCFSIRRNWDILTGPENSEDNIEGFRGIKVISMLIAICVHSILIFYVNCENPWAIEKEYRWFKYLLSGTTVVHTFLTISGMLTALAIQEYEKQHPLTPALVCKGIFLRWLRLIPSFAFVVAVVSTWLRFLGSGPLWQNQVVAQSTDCRRDWWSLMFMVNNYNDQSRCLAESWFVQADMQLTAVSLVLCLFTRRRALTLMLLLLGGMLSSAAHTYLMDLDGILLLGPSIAGNRFMDDPTFHHVYKRGHTNTPCYALGLIAGFMLHRVKSYSLHKYTVFRIIFWLLVPLGFSVVFSGHIFYTDFWPGPLIFRAAWAALYKTVHGIIISLLLLGLIVRIDNLYNNILSWRAWVIPSRLSYCVYLNNVLLANVISGLVTKLITFSILNMVLVMLLVIISTYLIAIVLWLLVEAPSRNLVKLILSSSRKDKKRN